MWTKKEYNTQEDHSCICKVINISRKYFRGFSVVKESLPNYIMNGSFNDITKVFVNFLFICLHLPLSSPIYTPRRGILRW